MAHIVPGIYAATTGPTVAAQHRRRMAEEERMATYSDEELAQDWEFKIVRATMPAFSKPETLQALLQEEALAGWSMVEKFDDNRVRFKRPRSARERDATLPEGVDPYRTQYGPAPVLYAALVIGVMLMVVLVVAVVGATLA